MTIYRLVRSEFKDDLSGYGAFLYGGRWNSKGQYALYCAQHISLAVLEIVVNYDRTATPLLPSYHLVEIQVPDSEIIEIDTSVLKKNWSVDSDYTQYIGDEFLQSKSDVILKIPSAVIPEESNYLLNPAHNDFKKVTIATTRQYGLDSRLF
ncbi:RES family NAD+ phosphorylase [Niabella ginsengisoli]|uniref:RES family NAD+ phosphorylase n=1 Tax=Niabella ginsengisoli TaxID=522298 RepID=A0ABS9SIH6_9BACT|nr:RES family NAD+ phosphorylase [Niabella ginsengisoli]MCH5598164.1 RES family NAD+ phosphorylase [Niabella ginsengisoli]